MRILIAWDVPSEAELLGLYLGAGDNEASVCLTLQDLVAQMGRGAWDIILLAATFPKTVAESFEAFQLILRSLANVPVLLACRQSEMLDLPKFLNHGLRFYLVRDEGGDFIFLTLSSLESAVEACRADESRKLAERLREEMDGVRRLQESIIPQGLKPPAGYSITARYEPSQVTVVGQQPVVMAGGDYYDIFRPDDRTLVVLIGDASGHGLKACMSIMTMHTLVRMFRGDRYRDTAAFVKEINERLCENSIVQQGGGFITLCYTAIDTIDHTMRWTSAGHPPPLIQNLENNEATPIGTDADCGLPLGIYPDVDYNSSVVPLKLNTRVLIYSDGLTDALPTNESPQFGVNGIVNSLRATATRPLVEALDDLFRTSSDYTEGAGRHDDTSVVLVERSITGDEAGNNQGNGPLR
jgi:sigma-B regulation protein RsbU (phosphoserine phosphatase)